MQNSKNKNMEKVNVNLQGTRAVYYEIPQDLGAFLIGFLYISYLYFYNMTSQ